MRLLFALVVVCCASFHRPDEISEGPYRDLGKCMIEYYRQAADSVKDISSLSDSRDVILFKRDAMSCLERSTNFVHSHQSVMKLVLLSSEKNRAQALYILMTHIENYEGMAAASAEEIGKYASVPAASHEAVAVRSLLRSHAAKLKSVRVDFKKLMEQYPRNESQSGYDPSVVSEIENISESITGKSR